MAATLAKRSDGSMSLRTHAAAALAAPVGVVDDWHWFDRFDLITMTCEPTRQGPQPDLGYPPPCDLQLLRATLRIKWVDRRVEWNIGEWLAIVWNP